MLQRCDNCEEPLPETHDGQLCDSCAKGMVVLLAYLSDPEVETVTLTCANCSSKFEAIRWQWEEDIQCDDFEPQCGCINPDPPGP